MASSESAVLAEPKDIAVKPVEAFVPATLGNPQWIVVGGEHQGGILVREGCSLNSQRLEHRLRTEAVVSQLDKEGDRLRYELLVGEGPSTGWVSTRVKDKDLLLPRELAWRDGSQPGDSLPSNVILFPRRRRQQAHPAPARPFRKVCVMGPYCTGTNAVMRDLEKHFDVVVRNPHRHVDPILWKHRIVTQAVLPDDTFAVCLVRDPGYWIQSLGRGAAETPSTFNELMPVKVYKDKRPECIAPKNQGQLFRHVIFEAKVYRDALQIWEETVSTYLDKSLWPPDRTVVARYEDYVCSFPEFMKTIEERAGFKKKKGCPTFEQDETTAKDTTHPKAARRGLSEIKADLRNKDKRYAGCSEGDIKRLRSLPSAARFGYNAENAVAEWLWQPAAGL